MSDYHDPLEEAFNDALEESASGLGYERQGQDGFELNEDFEDFEDFEGSDGFGSFDPEGDAFIGKAFKKFGSLVKRLPLKQLAQMGAKVAGGAIGGPIGAQLGGMVGGMLGEEEYQLEGDGFGDPEGDFEDEAGLLQEDESQAFGLDPFTDSLAESLASEAADAESDSEASAMLGGVTIHIVSGAPVSVRRVAPEIVRSATRLGRFLRRRPKTRQLTKTIAGISKQAVKILNSHARKGGKVTPATARKAMAVATKKTLGTPRAAAKTLANNAVKSRRTAVAPVRRGPGYKRQIARAER